MAKHLMSHLCLGPDTPRHNVMFMKYLAEHLGQIEALYLLGNVFATWTGDANRHHVTDELMAALAAFTQHTPIFMQTGTHDFLIGETFAKKTGVTLLPEHALVSHADKTLLLLHGHAFSQWHEEYQRLRSELLQAPCTPLSPSDQLGLSHQIYQTAQLNHACLNHGIIHTLLNEYGTTFASAPTIIHAHVNTDLTEPTIWRGRPVIRYGLPHWQQTGGTYLALTDETQWLSH